EGVETLTIDKLRAVGLDRLDTLLRASAGEMAAASGIRAEVAGAIVARLRAYQSGAASRGAAPDRGPELGERRRPPAPRRPAHGPFEEAASAWSDDARTAKREQRKARDRIFLAVKVVLARLGERDRIGRLDKATYHERIADLERFV